MNAYNLQDTMTNVEISIVVPVHDEAGNIADLVHEMCTAFAGRTFEIVVVNDASRDETLSILTALKASVPQLRVLSHVQNAGQSRAIWSGVWAARGDVIVTFDGDGQNPPADGPALVDALCADTTLGLVQGRRAKRQDTWSKRVASRVANHVRKRLLDDGAEDAGCGLKAVRRDVFVRLPYFDHMHRYMPALVKRAGFGVAFCDVGHRPRGAGRSKYTNLGRLFAAFSDLVGVIWLRHRCRQPGGVKEW
jgi:dolichol-phosphate mannosyltransferase